MNFLGVCNNIVYVCRAMFYVADYTYNMIVTNKLLLAFVLMCAIFIGCALIKRLINLNN